MGESAGWWEESAGYFDAFYLSQLRDPELTRPGELAFMLSEAVARPPALWLELGGGWGRLAIPLAKVGYRCTVLDSSSTLLERASAEAAAAGVSVDTIHGDMRTFDLAGFDVVMTNSLGYFCDSRDDMRVISSAAAALRHGGELILDLQSFAPVERDFVAFERLHTAYGDITFERSLDAAARRVVEVATRCFDDGSPPKRNVLRLRLFDATSAELLRTAGLSVQQMYGNYDRSPYDALSPRLILHCRKP